MYKIEWDSETGGVLLSSRVTKETLGVSPRPVFHEELDLIGQSQATLLGATLTLATGGPAQTHIGTGAGSSSQSELPWDGRQRKRR